MSSLLCLKVYKYLSNTRNTELFYSTHNGLHFKKIRHISKHLFIYWASRSTCATHDAQNRWHKALLSYITLLHETLHTDPVTAVQQLLLPVVPGQWSFGLDVVVVIWLGRWGFYGHSLRSNTVTVSSMRLLVYKEINDSQKPQWLGYSSLSRRTTGPKGHRSEGSQG